MDALQIAQTLAPLLPYLLKGGVELAQGAANELGKKLGADTWEGLKRLAEKIQEKAKGKPAEDALKRVVEKPDDPRIRSMVEVYLEEMLKEDSDLQAEATRLLAHVPPDGITVIAAGERSVAVGGDASDSTIITGEYNIVQRGKYNVRIDRASNIAIGDGARVESRSKDNE